MTKRDLLITDIEGFEALHAERQRFLGALAAGAKPAETSDERIERLMAHLRAKEPAPSRLLSAAVWGFGPFVPAGVAALVFFART